MSALLEFLFAPCGNGDQGEYLIVLAVFGVSAWGLGYAMGVWLEDLKFAWATRRRGWRPPEEE